MSDIIAKTLGLTILSYFLTFILTRIIGRKAISQMTFFDFVVGIIIGSIAANLIVIQKHSITSSITGLIIISLLVIIIDLLHIKSIKTSKLFDSEPVVIIQNGKIVDQNMKKTRLTLTELMMQLREKNAFNVADVEFALLETDGKISVLPKSQKQPVTPSDLNIPTGYKGLTKDLVIDGSIMNENLKDTHLDTEWLLNELKGYNIYDLNKVFYAGLDTSGNLYISKKHTDTEQDGKYGIE